MNIEILAAFTTFFFILGCIAKISYKEQHTDVDFIVGGRSLNFWVIALSAHASDMSSWLFMGFPAAIMIGGISQSWIAWGLLLGMFLNWQFVAVPLRKATEQLHSYTLSTFFERHFKDESGFLRLITATMCLIFLTCYLAAGLIGIGLLLEALFDINYNVGLILATLMAVGYTSFGGFTTVAWTDLFQALFLLLAILIVPFTAYQTFNDGTSTILQAAAAQGISFKLLPSNSVESILDALFLVLGWGLGYFGQPHIITKFMGIKSASDLYKSQIFGMTWMFLTLAAAIAVGIMGIAFFNGSLQTPELVFVEMVKQMYSPFIAGFILCAVIAAGMSTMDSQMLVCASVLSEDFYKHLFRKESSPQQLLKASRISVIVIALVALLISFRRDATVLETVQYAWTGLGCSFGPLVLTSLYSKKANRWGAFAGIITGGLCAASWSLLNDKITDIRVPAMIPGFILSFFSIYIVSKITEVSNLKKT